MPTLDDAVRRVWEVALPGEDARIKSIGGHGSEVGKMVMFHHEIPYSVAYERGRIQEQILEEATRTVYTLEQIDWPAVESSVRERLPTL